jgi:hypothetical protein
MWGSGLRRGIGDLGKQRKLVQSGIKRYLHLKNLGEQDGIHPKVRQVLRIVAENLDFFSRYILNKGGDEDGEVRDFN